MRAFFRNFLLVRPAGPLLRTLFLAVAIAGGACAGEAGNRLLTYPAPEGARLHTDFAVQARTPGGEWRDVDTYRIRVEEVADDGTHTERSSSLAYFDFSGEVEVSVRSRRGEISSARVRPLSYGIEPRLRDDTLSFTLDRPRNLSVEVNGDLFGNLHLFANSIEAARPSAGDPGVIYFGPGFHRLEKSGLRVPSGTTVYIAGGAVVAGRIVCDGVKDVRVLGRGMIDQEAGRLRIERSENVEVRGIFGRQFFTGASRNVTIADVKCISYGRWGDGMNVIASDDVLIDGVFNRNSDDCITVYATRGRHVGGCARVTVRNSTLWADVAHPILVGTHGETDKPRMLEQLRFENLDILDHMEPQLDYQGCLSLNAGDANLIRDVRFENIRVEDFRRGQLVNLRVFYNRKYNTSPGRGIENVLFKDLRYDGSRAELSVIAGYDAGRSVRNVVFENLTINGQLISDDMKKPDWFKTSDLGRIFVGDHVEGVAFRSGGKR